MFMCTTFGYLFHCGELTHQQKYGVCICTYVNGRTGVDCTSDKSITYLPKFSKRLWKTIDYINMVGTRYCKSVDGKTMSTEVICNSDGKFVQFLIA